MSGIDGRATGWDMQMILEDGMFENTNPETQYYYTPYSDIFHTSPYCPHIQNSNRLHCVGMREHLNGPYKAGAHRVASDSPDHCDLEECSWCEENGDDGRTCDFCTDPGEGTTAVYDEAKERVVPICSECEEDFVAEDDERTVRYRCAGSLQGVQGDVE